MHVFKQTGGIEGGAGGGPQSKQSVP
ncbi:hypothetical protein Ctob_016478 [Chrysochromulina tobinii]|uniref:Uncharacterized protein n=1 Tax=Chrysochromulina tobinii TaxID=1460289 RepID=A0A0M0KBH3_9EUKA|nr:hypothetical protein Ctob_016478 [Chrysochromulina tobinii]|eukprot:KOO35768.1 hypothetical protein Ctob_016478 [Chrysochromulina sp. CCMP291]